MSNINVCVFTGNLTRDPESREAGESTVVKFGLAVNERWKDKEETLFLECEAWNGLANIVSEYTKKGSKVGVSGQLKLETWEDKETGAKRSRHKLRVSNLELLDRKGDREESEAPKSKGGGKAPSAGGKGKGRKPADDEDDGDVNF